MGLRGPKSGNELMAIAQKRRANADNPRLNPIEPPDHLQPSTREWWAGIAPGLEPHQLRILTAAGEAWDRKEQARQAVAELGMSYTDGKGMVRARPECAIERDSRAAFMRGLQQLKLDIEPPKPRNAVFGLSWRDLE
jgi:phage terminase small subunit